VEEVFRLKGRLTTQAGAPAGGLTLALVDTDLLDDDDMIAVGRTGDDGAFETAFVPSQFRQDWFEDEATPDLKLVVSIFREGRLDVIFQRELEDLDWSGRFVDLGDIPLQGVNLDAPVVIEGAEPLPGYARAVSRLDIDDEMVKHCMAEVAPIVEHYTGWTGLLDGLKLIVADSLMPFELREAFAASGADPSSFGSKLTSFVIEASRGAGAGCAMYDPHIHAVIIQKEIMGQTSFEGLKVICGHELVHVGQYKHTVGLKGYNLEIMKNMLNPSTPVDPQELAAKGAYMGELESYAKYIELDFLVGRHYPMAMLAYHASLWERMVRGAVALLTEGVEEQRAAKSAQYTDGLQKWRDRAPSREVAARFELDMTRYPGGAAHVAAARAAGA